jgi:hypothetical protein
MPASGWIDIIFQEDVLKVDLQKTLSSILFNNFAPSWLKNVNRETILLVKRLPVPKLK